MATGQHDLADKMTRLMAAVGNPSTERLAEAIVEHTGTRISGAYLWQIKKGKRANLTLQHLTALSSYFSHELKTPITLSYFDPATPVDQPWQAAAEESNIRDLQEQLEAERQFSDAMKDKGVRRIAQRLGSMDAAQQRQFLAIADALAVSDSTDTHEDD